VGEWYFGEVRDGGEGREGVRLVGKMGERKKKRDLKAGHKGPETEYVRTYICAFDRTRAGECVSCSGMRSNLCKHVRTHSCSAVVESRRYGRTSPRQSRTQRSARSNLHKYVRTCSANFFFLTIYKIKIKINKYTNTKMHLKINQKCGAENKNKNTASSSLIRVSNQSLPSFLP
jgi:hypothetical protein